MLSRRSAAREEGAEEPEDDSGRAKPASGEGGETNAAQRYPPDGENVAGKHPVEQHQHEDVDEIEFRADYRRPDLDAHGHCCAHAESVHRLILSTGDVPQSVRGVPYLLASTGLCWMAAIALCST